MRVRLAAGGRERADDWTRFFSGAQISGMGERSGSGVAARPLDAAHGTDTRMRDWAMLETGGGGKGRVESGGKGLPVSWFHVLAVQVLWRPIKFGQLRILFACI